ncbi:hypothetical protein [uncultured Agrobacterium sp.]|uniref:hypothetical protein n=1 Tax=uncultured Agrobacterium sp. TaxID=157277 RepID=UPI00260106F9|nr:hypothetical protein [uncultured Agrobacterium sp.]
MTDLISSDWKETDLENVSPSPNGVQGGYSPSQVAPVIRAIRGSLKRFYNQSNAIYTTTGTATAYVLTFQAAPSGYSKGIVYRFWAHVSNTGAATLNINSLGEKSIVSSADGSALISGQIISGRMVEVVYNGTTFELLSETKLNSKLSGNTVLTGPLTINGAAGTDRLVGWRSSDKQRWAAFTNAAPETGGNLGSDFAVARYADDGNYIDAPLSISRKEGTVYVEKGLVVKDTVYIGNAGAALYADGNLKFVGNMATNQGAMYLSDALNNRLSKSGGTMTGTLGLPSVSDSSFRLGTADGASYTDHNLIMKGWWGMGMSTYDNSVNGYYDFRVGKWDTKGGTFRNGTEYVLPNGGTYSINITGAAGGLRDGQNPTNEMKFYWSGQSGQPEWIWGGNDGSKMYVYRPSELTVKNSAQLGGLAASDYATKAYVASNSPSLGIQQRWYAAGDAAIGSRNAGTIYQNTTGKAISVFIRAGNSGVPQVSNNGIDWINFNADSYSNITLIIPPNNFYRLNGGTYLYWHELR